MISSLKNNRKQNKLVKQMNILLVLLLSLVFVLAFIIVPCYKCEIRNLSKNPRNNVHFYVVRFKYNNVLYLYLGKPRRDTCKFYACDKGSIVAREDNFANFGLNPKDFENIKFEDEPVEVFLNLEN